MIQEKILNHTKEAKTQAVIFDFDGTLYDKSGLPARLIMAAPFQMGLLSAERKVRKHLAGKYYGTEKEYYQELFWQISHRHYRFRNVKDVKSWYNNTYMVNMVNILSKHYKIHEWVEPLIMELKSQGIKIAVLSDYGCLPQRLSAIGFNIQWADFIADAPQLGGLKPCREVFLKACQKIGIAPENALMVGDRDDTDGEGARRAGMPFIDVTL